MSNKSKSHIVESSGTLSVPLNLFYKKRDARTAYVEESWDVTNLKMKNPCILRMLKPLALSPNLINLLLKHASAKRSWPVDALWSLGSLKD